MKASKVCQGVRAQKASNIPQDKSLKRWKFNEMWRGQDVTVTYVVGNKAELENREEKIREGFGQPPHLI